ncbi:MAG: SigmaK-factor processing regulatory BofA [Clostridiales bacterium]|nr:SigmaK-factor processing regulatory BofA [Clostridiales bacterium]MBQ2818382.1 pro-sigmaK processing inhibitor BofA family protein [Clostridia bacterium]
MGLKIEPMVIVCFIFGLLALYYFGWLLLAPLKSLLRALFSGMLGAGALMLMSLLPMPEALTLSLNPVNALVAGFLGVPGVVMLMILQNVL